MSSNFITHLKLKHADIYTKFKILKSDYQGSPKNKFDDSVLDFIVDSASPVSVVDRPSFERMFEGTGRKIMCRQTAMKKLETRYENMLTKIKADIQSCKHFCTTADIWSGNHKSFFGYTCHWLTQDFERKSAALACKRLFGKHTADRIYDTIRDINSDFGLSATNIVMTVTDNGSNFVKTFKDHGVENCDHMEDDNDEVISFESTLLSKHHRCSSHTLNLLATTDLISILKRDEPAYIRHKMVICMYMRYFPNLKLNTVSYLQIFEKCNNLWKKSSWPKSSEVIVSTLGSSLVLPVITRWNSLYDAVVKLLQHKDVLNDLSEKLSLPSFTAGDIQYLESYKMLVEPIAETLDFLQGEKNIKFGFLLPAYMTLSNKLQKLSQNNEFALNSMAVELDEKLRKRFSKYFDLAPEADTAVTAAILTPNVKLNWLSVLKRTSPNVTTEIIITRALECILKFAVAEKLVPTKQSCSNHEDEIAFFDLEEISKFI